MIEEADIERFAALFRGNARSFGQYNPNAKTKMLTVKAAYTDEHIRSHLEGEIGLGMVPIMDDNNCLFAAIDIDTHGPQGGSVDLLAIDQRITRNNLPLTVCRSKSGGAHCYLFLSDPTPAERVRIVLGRWAAVLGYPQAEIFPKQVKLDKSPTEAERPLGNWINLPYYAVHETERYALDGGKQVTLEYFLELADSRRVNLKEYEEAGADAEYAAGPPCLQTMLHNKLDEGNRNIAVFQAGVFLKRAYPEDWRPRLDQFNRNALITPLDARELRTISNSVGRKEYQYKCREDPCRSLCNKDLCRTRQFGITDNDSIANEIPLIDSVEKVIATPIRWVLVVKGHPVELTTGELFNYEAVRQRVGEKLHLVLPRIKNQEWDQYLHEIMGKVKVRKDVTLEDSIYMKLCEYLRRTHVDKERPEDERRLDLRRGIPSMISISRMSFEKGKSSETGKEWYYAFKVTDFIEYLRRKKSLTVADHTIPSILYKLLGEDAKRDKIRVAGTTVGNIWCVPESSVESETVPEKSFDSEF